MSEAKLAGKVALITGGAQERLSPPFDFANPLRYERWSHEGETGEEGHHDLE